MYLLTLATMLLTVPAVEEEISLSSILTHLEHTPPSSPIFSSLLDLSGLMDEKQAMEKKYHGVILYGYTPKQIHKRINYLIQLWESGVRFDCIHLLTTDRPLQTALDDDFVSDFGISDPIPQHENKLMRWMWNHADMPTNMRHSVKIHVVNYSIARDSSTGRFTYPTREILLKNWVETLKPIGHFLAISSAPFIIRDDFVGHQFEHEKLTIETVGPEIDEVSTSLVLSEIHKLLPLAH